ncbi:methyltransferase domain-containing protein [Amycolatopsis sp. QT-25]|uniref:class I SAM-dependent methyltransferase n=1 Tax=Amycolatopsis sp. QT-25 TaxID=3034022 RepID=UPI0023ED8CFB|nr:methyltransferase domain-containing protein [Amycolatopsis sp. QT-25]WET83164.1 methyltransferase domain-containing protein [Amycolatopsis sp. QT-25]
MISDPYVELGRGYVRSRRPDPRIAAAVTAALGDARSVVNVGAGAGSYEPEDRDVVAVEPSWRMIAQRPAAAAPAVRACAEELPFPDGAFDAALAVLTVHHWTDVTAGLAELRRVSRRQVIVTWDQAVFARFWLVRNYLPEIAEHESRLACLDRVVEELGSAGSTPTVTPLPVPADCVDGFLGAYWRRPEAYLSERVRAGMSGVALLDQDVVATAVERLRADLADGHWHRHHVGLLGRTELDLGYRLVTA